MNGLAPAFSRAAARGPPAAATPQRWVRDDRHLLLVGAMLWTLLVLMIVPEGFDYSHLATADAPANGSRVVRLLWLALLAGGLAIIAWRAALARLLAHTLNPFLLAFVVLAVISIAWSIDAGVTARRVIRVLTIVVDSIAFVLMGWHRLRFQNVLRPLITTVLAASIAFGIGWPDYAIHANETGVLAGAWHGLANHKNGFGDLACVGLILWCHAWLAREVSVASALAGGALAATCLYLSHSSTSLVAAVLTLLFLAMMLRLPRGLRRYTPWLVASFVAVLLAYSVALLHVVPGFDLLLSPIGAITGKDLTFTGRTDIWAIITDHIRLSPFLGSGFAAYWTGPEAGTASNEYVRLLNFYPGSAHNGYLEVLNDLGGLGLTILFGYLISFVAQALSLLKSDPAPAALYLALFLQQALSNLSESRWFSPLSVDFVIMTLATAALARTVLEHRLRQWLGEPRRSARPALPAARALRPSLHPVARS